MNNYEKAQVLLKSYLVIINHLENKQLLRVYITDDEVTTLKRLNVEAHELSETIANWNELNNN